MSILVGSLGWCNHPVGAAEKHYMVVFSWQAAPARARNAHTFATFVNVADDVGSDDGPRIESHTISWLPRSLSIVVIRRFAEEGVNLDLQGSLDFAKKNNARITAWGPFEVQKELYERALRQIDRLNSGEIAYKAIDRRFRDMALNCMHAVADIDTDNGILSLGSAYGEEASARVAQHLRRWMIDPKRTSPWVAEQLGLGDYDVRYESLPGTGVILE